MSNYRTKNIGTIFGWLCLITSIVGYHSPIVSAIYLIGGVVAFCLQSILSEVSLLVRIKLDTEESKNEVNN